MNPQQRQQHQQQQQFLHYQPQTRLNNINKINPSYYNTFSVPMFTHIPPSYDYMMPPNLKSEIKEEYSDIQNET